MTAKNRLPAGTILLSDSDALGCQGGVHFVDPGTGIPGFFALGGDLVGATGIALEPDDNVLVTKDRPHPGTGTLLRLSRSDGKTAQTTVSSEGNFVTPIAVAVENDGNILVADLFSKGPGAVIRVNPVTGEQTVLSMSDATVDPLRPCGLCVAADGTIVLVEQAGPIPEPPAPRVVRIDPVSGARTVISSGGKLVSPVDVAIDHAGNILVVDANAFEDFSGGVIKVDPVSGAQTVMASGGSFDSPAAIAVEADGNLLITDNNALTRESTLFRVNAATGDQHVLASGPPFRALTGVRVVPTP
ncbi:Vgb family protein [Streptomyces sp. NPDC001450]